MLRLSRLNADILVDVFRHRGVNFVAFVSALQLLSLSLAPDFVKCEKVQILRLALKQTACRAFPHSTGYYNALL